MIIEQSYVFVNNRNVDSKDFLSRIIRLGKQNTKVNAIIKSTEWCKAKLED